MAREQAQSIAADVEKNGGPANLAEQDIVAIVAYIQRLGSDIKLASATPAAKPAPGSATQVARSAP